jgi:hypothetical protein
VTAGVDELVVAAAGSVPQVEQCFLGACGLITGQQAVGVVALTRSGRRRRSVHAD